MKTKVLVLTSILAVLFSACETTSDTEDCYPYDNDAINNIAFVHYQWTYDISDGDFSSAYGWVSSENYSDFGNMTGQFEKDLNNGFREGYYFSNVKVIAFEVDSRNGYLVGAWVKGNCEYYQYVNDREVADFGIFYSVVLNNANSPENDWELNLFRENTIPSWWLSETGSGLISKGKSEIRYVNQ